MKVRYLDLETGQRAEETGISEFNLTENNWSCDCNRALAFDGMGDVSSGTCDGCKRYIVIGVEPEGDEQFDESEIIKEANREYYMRLKISKLIDALRFYADPETYHATTILFDEPCGDFADDIRTDHDHEDYDRAMPGSLARTVLLDVGVSW